MTSLSSGAALRRVALLWASAALLVACGGGSDAPAPTPPPANAPGGLYVGYYAESPTNNPEDPTLGLLHMALPANDAAFSGAMFFTYVGCQTQNVGTINGNRTGSAIAGTWAGTIDGSAQNGAYIGNYSATTGLFSGTYTVAGGKQLRDLSPCISYIIASNGTWELLPAGQSVPPGFTFNVVGSTVQWANPAGTALTLVAVLDEALAIAGNASASRFQTVGDASVTGLNLNLVPGLIAGRRYVIAVSTVNAQGQRLTAASIVVTR